MKKTLLILSTFALFVACQDKGKSCCSTDTACSDSTATDSVYFAGEVPAASGPGIRYEVALAQDSTNGVRLTETYLEAEEGKDATTVYVGKAEKVTRQVNGADVTGWQFDFENDNVYRFVQPNDSTLRLVNAEWQESDSGLNYDLKIKK